MMDTKVFPENSAFENDNTDRRNYETIELLVAPVASESVDLSIPKSVSDVTLES